MSYTTNTPRGDLLPVDERPRFQNNFTYIQTNLRDDHFWNEDANLDGHHRRMALPDIADTGITLTGSDPSALPTDATGQFYVRPKTSNESPEAQNSEPFYMMNDGAANQFLQLGVRAMVTFRVASNAITLNSNGDPWDYQHNVSGVTRNAAGLFTVTFATALPTTRYCVVATCEADGTGNTSTIFTSVRNGTKLTTSVGIRTARPGDEQSVNRDPSSVSVIVMGG